MTCNSRPVADGTAESLALVSAHEASCDTCRVLTGTVRSLDGLPARSAAVTAGPGQLFGRYLLLDRIGRGGMGTVFAAYDPPLDRKVALKLIEAEPSEPSLKLSDLREPQALARLSHPNVVAVYDAGTIDGQVYIAMELVEGVTLRAWAAEAPRSWRAVLRIFLEAAKGLIAIHRAGLVHLDFKPENVLIDRHGGVRITDFGLARVHGARSSRQGPGVPLPGQTVLGGTPGYMAPEQWVGLAADGRSDQFAFCAALFEALYGRLPFSQSSLATLPQDSQPSVPARRPTLPAWLKRALLQGLAIRPEDRFASMQALANAIDRGQRASGWRLAPALASALILALGGASLLARAGHARRRCDAEQAMIRADWSEAARAKVRSTFGSSTRPWANSVLTSTERAIDAWVDKWEGTAARACEATIIRGDQTESAYQLQQACLSQRQDELRTLLGLLGTGDEGVLERSATLAWTLTPSQVCADAANLARDQRLAASVRNGRVRGLDSQVRDARAFFEAGKSADAERLLVEVTPAVRELGLKPLESEIALVRGDLASQVGQHSDAAEHYLHALVTAQACGYSEGVARAASRLSVTIGFHQGRVMDGKAWAALGSATIEALGGNAELLISHTMVLARLANAEGKTVDAVQCSERALELTREFLGDEHPMNWSVEFNLGASLVGALEPQRAVVHLERAFRLRERTVSAEHPDAALVQATLANAYYFAGRPEDSRRAFSAALATRERLLGTDSPRLVVMLANHADTLSKSGMNEQALAHLDRATRIAATAYPPDHVFNLVLQANRAEILQSMGKRAEAKNRYDALLSMQPPLSGPLLAEVCAMRALLALEEGQPQLARTIAERGVSAARAIGERSAELILPLLALGQAQTALSLPLDASRTLETARSIAAKTRSWAAYESDVLFALSRARRASGADAAEVRDLAKSALTLCRPLEGQAARVEHLEAYLAALERE